MEPTKDIEWLKRMAEEEKSYSSPNIPPSIKVCRFCSHAPCICDEYLVTAEEAEKWWRSFAEGSKGINPADLRRLIVTVVRMYEHPDIESMTIDEALAEMNQHVYSISQKALEIGRKHALHELHFAAKELLEQHRLLVNGRITPSLKQMEEALTKSRTVCAIDTKTSMLGAIDEWERNRDAAE